VTSVSRRPDEGLSEWNGHGDGSTMTPERELLAQRVANQFCPSCGGKSIWISREFRPYPRWTYAHKRGCPAGKFYPQPEQDKVGAAFGACPIHGTEPALTCQPCCDIADTDTWVGERL
jgi:hypothetical protein